MTNLDRGCGKTNSNNLFNDVPNSSFTLEVKIHSRKRKIFDITDRDIQMSKSPLNLINSILSNC